MKQYLINTGNILSLSDITRKSGLNPAEELKDAIYITIDEYGKTKTEEDKHTTITHIKRQNDDLRSKIEEQSLNDLKIGFKIFLTDDSKEIIQESISEGFNTLNVPCVHNVIISLNNSSHTFESIQKIWSVLEDLVQREKICQIGLADVDETVFRTIYEWAAIKPKIIQINLATCCVVPPTLQAFCKDNEVQLLTHSDPADMLSPGEPKDSLGRLGPTKWILRYLVHIKCRGVLITKGYLVRLDESK